MYRSQFQALGGDEKEGPDYLYYNADIINNTTDDQASGFAVRDPNITFNETRDAPLLLNASDYHFSIVRFAMNGPNKDLPLFIPTIQTGTGQDNVNLSVYAMALSAQMEWTTSTPTTVALTLTPTPRFIQYEPETKNPDLAPIPNSLAAPTYSGAFDVTQSYNLPEIVGSGINAITGSGVAPYFAVRTPRDWDATTGFPRFTLVKFGAQVYINNTATTFSPTGTNPPPSAGGVWSLGTYTDTSPFVTNGLWSSAGVYAPGNRVITGGNTATIYQAINAVGPSPLSPDQDPANWAYVTGVGPQSVGQPFWAATSAALGVTQDLSTRYYWIYNYQHWLDLVNKTLYNPADGGYSPMLANLTPSCCAADLFKSFYDAWVASPLTSVDPFPFNTLDDFLTQTAWAPRIERDDNGNKFRIYFDSEGYGTRLTSFTPFVPALYSPPYPAWSATETYVAGDKVTSGGTAWEAVTPVVGVAPAGPDWVSADVTPTSTLATSPLFKLYFNTNTFGLFTNFPNRYWNQLASTGGDGQFNGLPDVVSAWNATVAYPNGAVVLYTTTTGAPAAYVSNGTGAAGDDPLGFPSVWTLVTRPLPQGYTNEISVPNKFYSNVADYRLPPYSSGGAPPLGYVPIDLQRPYWVVEQEQPSTDSLWSPISAIVFTSTLLPVKAEQTGPPVSLGAGNIGNSAATAPSAFQPIVTDIALDTSASGAGGYRSLIYYAPTAEYRLSDFGASKQPIRSIDIQVYWKCRLNAQLYPIQMFNLSSVSFKMMFKKKGTVGKAERTEIGM